MPNTFVPILILMGKNENKNQNTKFDCLNAIFLYDNFLMPYKKSMIKECDLNWMRGKPAKIFFKIELQLSQYSLNNDFCQF